MRIGALGLSDLLVILVGLAFVVGVVGVGWFLLRSLASLVRDGRKKA